MARITQSFHNMVDTTAKAYQVYTPGGAWKIEPIYIPLRQRSVAYQFFPHFHPYVGRDRSPVPGMQLSLIQRLKEGGVTELQDSDTLYMPQPNPNKNPVPLQVLPNTTRATLAADLTCTRPNGTTPLPLPAGPPLPLPRGATATSPARTP